MSAGRQATRAVIYARVSQDREGKQTSVSQQLDECRRLAAERKLQVVQELWDNDISAYTGKKRPAYDQLLELIRSGDVDAVVVWEQSRLTRRPYELEGYIEACEPRSVPTYTVSAGQLDLTTDQGRMVARMTGAVNRYEVDQLKGRVKRGLRARAAAGQPSGGRRPFGFLADKVTHEPTEAALLMDATKRIVEENEAIHTIAREWRAAGVLTTTGGTWSTGQIRTVLRRPRNAGLMQQSGKIVGRASWDPIVPVELWTACTKLLDDPERRSSPGNQPGYLGTFIYRCGALIDGAECGKLMRSWRSGTPAVKVYRCTTTDRTTRHVTIPIAETDEYVADHLITGLYESGYGLPMQVAEQVAPSIDDALADLDKRQSTLAVQYVAEVLSEDAYLSATAVLEARREQLRKSIAPVIHTVSDRAFNIEHEWDTWNELSLVRQRALIQDLTTVTILPVGSGRRVPIADRIRIELDFSGFES